MQGSSKTNTLNRIFQSLNQFSILVVEDDTVQRELLKQTLKTWGMSVFEADSGETALNLLLSGSKNIRVVITDLQMPQMDGITLIKEIQKRLPHRFYIIAVSGIGDPNTIQRALETGASDFMKKPFLAEQLFVRLAVLDKLLSLEEDYENLVRGLFDVMTEMLGTRDSYTLEHSIRVAELSVRTARLMGIEKDDLEVLELGCLVHDMGKIAIPDDVLLKPGPFDAIDRKIMNLHPKFGARFLASRYPDPRVSEIALQHHERLDGSGYPNGLPEGEIEPLVLIVSICDVYEALVARRPYKRPMSKERALAIIDEDVKKGRFYKDAVEALKEVLTEWDPLLISREPSDDLQLIESFRKKTYFREPLCSFYNYRYIFALEKERLIDTSEEGSIFLIDVKNIADLNKRYGYLKTDEILDELGEHLQDRINMFMRRFEDKDFQNVILFRKGPDFIILSTYGPTADLFLKEMIDEILKEAYKLWGIDIMMKHKTFSGHKGFRQSLDFSELE